MAVLYHISTQIPPILPFFFTPAAPVKLHLFRQHRRARAVLPDFVRTAGLSGFPVKNNPAPSGSKPEGSGDEWPYYTTFSAFIHEFLHFFHAPISRRKNAPSNFTFSASARALWRAVSASAASAVAHKTRPPLVISNPP